jgi:hypothetical protein
VIDEPSNSKSQNSNDMDNKTKMPDRRSFLKLGGVLGASLIAVPDVTIANTGENKSDKLRDSKGSENITKQRTLGSGNFSMQVSALGLGCMGMRSSRPYS